MKRFYLTLAAGLFAIMLMAVGLPTEQKTDGKKDVGAEIRTPHNVTLTATDKGFMIPRITTAQRDAIVKPLNGMKIFNTDAGVLQVFSNASGSPTWSTIRSPGSNEGC